MCRPKGWGFGAFLVWKQVYIHFAHFGLESVMVFEGTTGVYERIYRKEIEICTLEMHLKIFCLRSNLSIDDIISA